MIPPTIRAYVAHIKPSYRYVYTVLIFASVMLVWWIGVYSPLQELLTAYSARNIALRTQCVHAMSCTKSVRSVQESIDCLVRTLDRDSLSINADWASTVIKTAQGVGLTVDTYHADTECAKEWYSCARARFEVSGTLDQIINFLFQLHRVNQCLGSKQWTLSQSGMQLHRLSCTLNNVFISSCNNA